MGGNITVQSEFGKGTTFSISVSSKVKISKIDLKKFELETKPLANFSRRLINLEPLDIVSESEQEMKNSMQINRSSESNDILQEINSSKNEIS